MSTIVKNEDTAAIRSLSTNEREQVGGAGLSIVRHGNHYDMVYKVWGVTIWRTHLPAFRF